MRRSALAAAAVAVLVAAAIVATMAVTAGAQRSSAKGWARVPGVAATAHAAKAAPASGRHRLVVIARTVRDANVDVGPTGESPGDFFLFEDDIYSSPAKDRLIGHDSGRCELRIRTFSCEATLKLAHRGKITVDGALFSERDNAFAITGGTGRFSRARGTLNVVELPGGDEALVFRLR